MKKKRLHLSFVKNLKSKSGTSMVEVLVAFMVVMVMVVMFSQIVMTSVKLFKRSKTIIENTEQFNATYYKTAERGKRDEVTGSGLVLSVVPLDSKNSNKAVATSLELTRGHLLYYKDAATGMGRYSIGIINSKDADDAGN